MMDRYWEEAGTRLILFFERVIKDIWKLPFLSAATTISPSFNWLTLMGVTNKRSPLWIPACSILLSLVRTANFTEGWMSGQHSCILYIRCLIEVFPGPTPTFTS